MGNYSEVVETQMVDFFCSLNERDRRRYAAIEAVKLGHEGIEYISRLLGCHRETVAHGITELNSKKQLTTNRIRKKGGGRRRLTVVCPCLVENVLRILHDHTAGDPMRQEVRWTNLSRRNISRQLEKTDTLASKNIVSKVLYEQGFRRRKPQKKRTMGQNKDRDAQFRNLKRLKQEYLDAGKPVLSMDTKKKETLGNFYREGVTDAIEPTIVNDHDFPSQGNGKVIPHGIYDLGKNKSVVHLNTSKYTSEFSCECIALWWLEHGQKDYPNEDEILIMCDGGGSKDRLEASNIKGFRTLKEGGEKASGRRERIRTSDPFVPNETSIPVKSIG